MIAVSRLPPWMFDSGTSSNFHHNPKCKAFLMSVFRECDCYQLSSVKSETLFLQERFGQFRKLLKLFLLTPSEWSVKNVYCCMLWNENCIFCRTEEGWVGMFHSTHELMDTGGLNVSQHHLCTITSFQPQIQNCILWFSVFVASCPA